MKKRIIKLILIAMVFTLISAQITYSHSLNQSGYISWGELCGWGINEGIHTNSTNLTYYFYSNDSDMTDAHKNIIRNGASRWSSYGTISESSSGTGKIHTAFDASVPEVAALYEYNTNSSGHFIYWVIRFNRAKPFTSTTAAHEFGHAFGLYDLYNNSNLNKLMHGTEDRIASAPTAQDIKGFKVITGQHSYHYSWAYKAVPGYPINIPIHMRYCPTCDGFEIENCSPSSGVCNICAIYH